MQTRKTSNLSANASAGTAYATGNTTTSADDTRKIQLREEQLNVTKKPVETGEVRVHKEVHTEQRTIQVPVKREEIVVERHAVSGQTASGEIGRNEEIRIPVREEQVQVDKNAVVKEEVTVGKRQVQDTEQVGGTVRKEEVRIEKKGDVNVKGEQGRRKS